MLASQWTPAGKVKGVIGSEMCPILWVLWVLLGLVLAVVAWGFWYLHGHEVEDGLMTRQDSLLLWLSCLAALALGTFLAYFLAGLGS
jgi:hypothetical protein